MEHAEIPSLEHLDLSLVARVATVTLDRPRSRNALNRALRRSVGLAIEGAENSVDVDVVVLTGAGPAFCAGLDTRELGTEPTAADLADVMRYPRGPLPPRAKPLIGAINGPPSPVDSSSPSTATS